MMNALAMWLLLASLAAAIVMSPEPTLVKTPYGEQHPMDLAKEAAKESLHYTGESIRRSVTSASHIPSKAAHSAAQVIKDSSQAGLEKIGLAQPAEPPSHFELWESSLQASKDRAAALKHEAGEATGNAGRTVRDTLGRGYEEQPKPTPHDHVKEKVDIAVGATKDATVETAGAAKNQVKQAVKAVKDTVVGAGEWIQDEAHAAYQSTADTASAIKQKAGHAVGLGRQKEAELALSTEELGKRIAQSVEDTIHAAEGKVAGTTESAYDHAAEGVRKAGAKATHVVGLEERPPTYQEKIHQAREHAADILKSRGKEAASVLPNVGQGLSYGGAQYDVYEPPSVGEYMSKAEEWIGVGGKEAPEAGRKSRIGEYVEGMKGKLKGSRPNVRTGDWREDVLNKLGINSEEDLSKKDIMIGNFRGFFSGGKFHEIKEALSSAATATQDTARAAGERASGSLRKAGGVVEHAKDAAAEEVQEVKGHFHTIDEDHTLTNKTADLFQRVTWVTNTIFVSACRTGHLFAFSTVFGTSLWVSFVSGYLLSRTVPRQQFGYVQSRVFPTYLKLVAGGQFVCLALYVFLHPWAKADGSQKLQYLDLWGILMCTLANVFFLEPRATKMMFEKLKMEKEEGRGQDGLTDIEDDEIKAHLAKINKSFHILHGYSSLANLLSLLGMTWHLWHLSLRLIA